MGGQGEVESGEDGAGAGLERVFGEAGKQDDGEAGDKERLAPQTAPYHGPKETYEEQSASDGAEGHEKSEVLVVRILVSASKRRTVGRQLVVESRLDAANPHTIKPIGAYNLRRGTPQFETLEHGEAADSTVAAVVLVLEQHHINHASEAGLLRIDRIGYTLLDGSHIGGRQRGDTSAVLGEAHCIEIAYQSRQHAVADRCDGIDGHRTHLWPLGTQFRLAHKVVDITTTFDKTVVSKGVGGAVAGIAQAVNMRETRSVVVVDIIGNKPCQRGDGEQRSQHQHPPQRTRVQTPPTEDDAHQDGDKEYDNACIGLQEEEIEEEPYSQ